MSIGKIIRSELRNVWNHEAHDFTRWLAENVEVLNDVIDANLTIVEREAVAGDFRLDLLAETDNGRPAVIENQFGRSNHDHLGKLITYHAAFDAEIAIWIVEQPRSEHVSAVSWLNESCASTSFYLIQAEAISIGTSEPALLLTKIVGPSEGSKAIASDKQQISDQQSRIKQFWTELLERAKNQTSLHANISASKEGWISTGTGMSGIGLNYVVGKNWWRVEIYVSKGKDSKEENERIFDSLMEYKDSIEREFGSPLDWGRLETRQACRVSFSEKTGGYGSQQAAWPEIHDSMIRTMIRFDKAIRKPLEETMHRLNANELSTTSR